MSEPEDHRGTPRPDRPTPDRTTGEEPTPDERGARHPDLQAELRERSDGANAEQITDEANLRANPDPPD